jgi:hypothetical protein
VNNGTANTQIYKLIAEVDLKPTLKEGFESGEIVFDAWKWIDDGIPALPDGIPVSMYVNYLKKKTNYISQASEATATVKYYRVQQAGPVGPEEILSVDPSGNIIFGSSSNNWLNFSTDNIDHALYFKSIDPSNRYIIEFEMPKLFDIMMKEATIPQWGATSNVNYFRGLSPQVADPNQPGHPFTARLWREYWQNEFQQNVIPGSGVIIN